MALHLAPSPVGGRDHPRRTIKNATSAFSRWYKWATGDDGGRVPGFQRILFRIGDTVDLLKTVFLKGPDTVGQQWLKSPTPVRPEHIHPHVTQQLVAVAEALMIAPRVSFKVWGENIVLPMLVAGFGVEQVTELLENKVIEFVQWRPLIAESDLTQDVVADLLRQGLNPVAAGYATNAEYADPEAAISSGLSKWGQSLQLGRPVRRQLTNLAVKRTRVLANESSQFAVERVTSAYLNGELCDEGFDPNTSLTALDTAHIHQLATKAARLVEVGALVKYEYDLYQGADTWQTLESLCRGVAALATVGSVTERVLSFERLPSISALLGEGALSLRDIPRLRERPAVEDYRRWLWLQPDPSNVEEVARAYLKALTPQQAITERTWFRPAHLSVTQGIGLIVGLLMAPLGFAAGTLANVAQAVLDDAVVTRLSKTSNPRQFATEVLGPRLTQATIEQGGKATPMLEAQVTPLTWATAVLPQAALGFNRASNDVSREITIPVNYRVTQVEA